MEARFIRDEMSYPNGCAEDEHAAAECHEVEKSGGEAKNAAFDEAHGG